MFDFDCDLCTDTIIKEEILALALHNTAVTRTHPHAMEICNWKNETQAGFFQTFFKCCLATDGKVISVETVDSLPA